MKSFLAPFSTIHFESNEEEVHYVLSHYDEQLQFLSEAPLYDIIGDVLFTHAGYNSQFDILKQTTDRDFIWIRKHYLNKNITPFINVFGHTPTKYIHDSNDIWVSKDKRYIAIDCGCYMSGQLNAVLLSQNGEILDTYTTHSQQSEVYT